MRFFDFASVKITIFFILGILMGKYWEPPIIPLFLTLILLASLLFWPMLKQKRNSFPFFELLTALTIMFLGVFVMAMTLPKNDSLHFLNHQPPPKSILHLKIRERLKTNDFSERYIAKVESVDKKEASGKIVLDIEKESACCTLKPDDEILVYSNFKGINAPLNPHQFNYQDYMKNLGVYGQVNIPKNGFVKAHNPSTTLRGNASNFRERLIEKLREYKFDKEQLGVIQAILLGERRGIGEHVYDDYKDAGAVHILAVSGLHIGILLLLLQLLLRPLERLPRGKTLKLILIVLLLWSYAFVAGLSPSILRAVTMFSFLTYSFYLNRPTNTLNIVALSMFFLLLVWPNFLFQVGFQLSYSAVFSIVWLYPKLQGFWYPNNWFLQKGWQLLSVSIAAQIGVLPISLFYFHQFPALFFVSNLLVVPFLGIILGFGIFVLILALFNFLPNILVQFYNHLIGLMNLAISWVARQESFLFKDIPFDGVQLLLSYMFLFGLIFTLSKKTFKNVAFVSVAALGFVSYLTYQTYLTQQTEKLLLLHQSRNSILLHQHGAKLMVLTKDSVSAERSAKDFGIAERIEETAYSKIKNSYLLNSERLLIIDSTGVFPMDQNPKYILLTDSPKINLSRVLDSLKPKVIIADGSNYKSYVSRWKKTCVERKVPFHYTGEKGAYYFELNDSLVNIAH